MSSGAASRDALHRGRRTFSLLVRLLHAHDGRKDTASLMVSRLLAFDLVAQGLRPSSTLVGGGLKIVGWWSFSTKDVDGLPENKRSGRDRQDQLSSARVVGHRTYGGDRIAGNLTVVWGRST